MPHLLENAVNLALPGGLQMAHGQEVAPHAEVQRQVQVAEGGIVQVAGGDPGAVSGADGPAGGAQLFQHAVHRHRAHRHPGNDVGALQGMAVAGGQHQFPQDGQGHHQALGRRQAGGPHLGDAAGAPFRQGRRHLRPEQDQAPHQVQPQQHRGEHRQGAVDGGVGMDLADVEGEADLRHLHGDAGHHAAHHGVLPAHRPGGDGQVGEAEESRLQQAGQHTAHQFHHHRAFGTQVGDGDGGQRQTDTQQQGRHGQHRPEGQHAHQHRMPLAAAPNGVVRPLDGEEEQDGRERQAQHAHPRHGSGVADELMQAVVQVLPHLGHQVLQQQHLRLGPQLLEGGEGLENGEAHGEQRHHRQEAGVGERAHGLQAVVAIEAADGVAGDPDEGQDGVLHRLWQAVGQPDPGRGLGSHFSHGTPPPPRLRSVKLPREDLSRVYSRCAQI
ncbi:Flavodoxin, putative [Nitrospirillum viridazoti Y2]|nr:Flavodoxin, putative [Nitrospirillum amazonense Y2]